MAITLTIGIIFIGALLVPAINDAEHSGATNYSNGDTNMKEVGSSIADLIISNQNSITSDGDIITGHSYPAVMCDGITIYITNNGVNIFWTTEGIGHWSAMNGANVTIDGTNKTVSLTNITPAPSNNNLNGATELDIPYTTQCYYRASSGDYVGANTSQISQVKVLSDDQVISSFFKSSKYAFATGTSTTEDGSESETPITLTLADSTPEEFKTISAINWIDNSSPIAIVVPATIWTESAIDQSSLHIIFVLPVLFIVGLLVFATRLFMNRD